MVSHGRSASYTTSLRFVTAVDRTLPARTMLPTAPCSTRASASLHPALRALGSAPPQGEGFGKGTHRTILSCVILSVSEESLNARLLYRSEILRLKPQDDRRFTAPIRQIRRHTRRQAYAGQRTASLFGAQHLIHRKRSPFPFKGKAFGIIRQIRRHARRI